mmetsp:Transcript_7929/g.14026  ORF Transcript_7929/g.14026 Transcript_7929/m.14026 type:complete len:88 (+) Transcript_7929:293-556(+)
MRESEQCRSAALLTGEEKTLCSSREYSNRQKLADILSVGAGENDHVWWPKYFGAVQALIAKFFVITDRQPDIIWYYHYSFAIPSTVS